MCRLTGGGATMDDSNDSNDSGVSAADGGPALRLPSYRPCPHDGLHCVMGTSGFADTPCWGDVGVYGSFFDDAVHTCRGHEDFTYAPPDPSAGVDKGEKPCWNA